MAERDDDDVPEWAEVLGRGPIRILDDTTSESLAEEMAERLRAIFRASNGLEPTADGWRQMALEIALEHHPLFKIETPVDRETLGGRPVGLKAFSLRSRMKAEMRKGKSQVEAARTVSKESKGKISVKTAQLALSRKVKAPDFMRLWPYRRKAEDALSIAADIVSQE